MTDLRHSPLHAEHEKLGASFTPFGPWNMPLKYGNELEEHRAVRATAGLFDLSHMGEVRITGPEAPAFLDYALISHLSAIAVGRAKYTMIVNEEGGILDDLIVYRLAEQEYLVVPNAGNAELVAGELAARAEGFEVTVTDESADTALIAVQGPNAQVLLHTLVAPEDVEAVSTLRYYAALPLTVAGHPVLLARTGYTGEDGFELFLPNEGAVDLWQKILTAGQSEEFGLKPAGLAARDSLRLEAGMPLYGNELNVHLTPHAAGLGVLVGKKKEGDFIGKDALLQEEASHQVPDVAQAKWESQDKSFVIKLKSPRILVGLTSSERRAARAHATIHAADGTEVGEVTSGQPSPTLGHPIALAYVDRAFAEPGTELQADIRGKKYPFTVVALPFYKRAT